MSIRLGLAICGTIIALLLTSQPVWAQKKGPEALSNRVSILDGRAYLSFPANAVSSARPVDIMSVKPNEQLETRVVLDVGKSRVVFFARELFRLTDKQFVRQAAVYKSATFSADPQLIRDTDSLTAVLSTAARHDTTASAILLKRLLVRTIDNTVFEVAAYVNPAGFGRRAEFEALANRVFRTVRPGQRLFNRSARTETHDELVFALPENYCLTRKQSYDFWVYTIWPIEPLLSDTNSNVTVYLGHHPSPIFRDEGVAASTAQLTAGHFLGKSIQWMGFSKPASKLYWREQIIPSATGKDEPLAHVFVRSTSPEKLPSLTAIVEAITRKK